MTRSVKTGLTNYQARPGDGIVDRTYWFWNADLFSAKDSIKLVCGIREGICKLMKDLTITLQFFKSRYVPLLYCQLLGF